jgi:hypothetical protein
MVMGGVVGPVKIMKCFNRITCSGAVLPERGRADEIRASANSTSSPADS